MSTSYYGLKKPITSIRIEPPLADKENPRKKITIWVNHQYSGQLVLNNNEVRGFLEMIFDMRSTVISTYLGDFYTGLVVQEHFSNTQDEDSLLSETFGYTTAGDVRAKAGQGRRKNVQT